jgi:hypothetical protein
VQKLRESARIFVDAMLPGDGIGLVRFDDTSQKLMDVQDVGALTTGAGRVAAIGHINGSELDPAGATSIGAGVQQGKTTVDAAVATPPYSVKAMVVLTDGVENTSPMLSSVGASITSQTFAIGLGTPYNISTAALNTLTQGHNGYLLVTGTLSPDQRTRLTKYFLQILAGITNANVVLDPHGELGYGEEHRIPFALSDADYGFDAFVLTAAPWALDYELETPSGDRIDAATITSMPTGAFVVRDGVAFYRSALPALSNDINGSHAGTWTVVLRLGHKGQWNRDVQAAYVGASRGVLPYDVLVHSYSNLSFRASASQTSYEPGAEVSIFATVREYDVDLGSLAVVWADVTRPDGGTQQVKLKERNGQYQATFKTGAPGLYEVRAHAQGQTFAGIRFTREQVLTAAAVPGADRPGDSAGASDPLTELLCCLASKKGLSDEFWKTAERSGIDPRALKRCLAAICHDRPARD